MGLHIYTGGVIFQQLLICCFIVLTIRFKVHLEREVADRRTRQKGTVLIRVLRVSLALVTVSFLFNFWMICLKGGREGGAKR